VIFPFDHATVENMFYYWGEKEEDISSDDLLSDPFKVPSVVQAKRPHYTTTAKNFKDFDLNNIEIRRYKYW